MRTGGPRGERDHTRAPDFTGDCISSAGCNIRNMAVGVARCALAIARSCDNGREAPLSRCRRPVSRFVWFARWFAVWFLRKPTNCGENTLFRVMEWCVACSGDEKRCVLHWKAGPLKIRVHRRSSHREVAEFPSTQRSADQWWVLEFVLPL